MSRAFARKASTTPSSSPSSSGSTRIPALGPRGEGWVALQLALLSAIVASGFVGGPWPELLRYPALAVGVVVAAGGAALAVAGARALGRGLTALPRPREGAALVIAGVYGRARHPIYGGLVLLSLGWALAMTSVWALGLSAMLWLVLELKSRREEAWLGERDEAYAAYRDRVPGRLLPRPTSAGPRREGRGGGTFS